MSKRVWIGIAVVVAIQLGLVALYLHKRRRPEAKPFVSETLSASEAPALSFAYENGRRGSLAELRGKVVLVHFWGTWCEPCRVELPGLLARADELAREKPFVLVAVAIDDDWNAIREFFAGSIPTAVVMPTDGDVHRQFGARALPDTYLVDSGGKLVERYAGARDWTQSRAVEHLAHVIDSHKAAR